jgi:hypothetical protein
LPKIIVLHTSLTEDPTKLLTEKLALKLGSDAVDAALKIWRI